MSFTASLLKLVIMLCYVFYVGNKLELYELYMLAGPWGSMQGCAAAGVVHVAM